MKRRSQHTNTKVQDVAGVLLHSLNPSNQGFRSAGFDEFKAEFSVVRSREKSPGL
jgi:hypothetical protein